MVGMLSYLVGGALKGAGDAMVEKAKQQREDALLALAEQNKRTDAATAHNYDTQNIAQQQQGQQALETQREAFQGGETDKEIAAHHEDVATTEAGADKRTSIEQSGANSRTAQEIEGRHEDTATTTQASRDVAGIRAGASEYRANLLADRASNGKPLTAGQALMAARQAYSDNYKSGVDMTDSDGKPIPANEWIANEADRLMARNASARSSGGLTNPYGTSSPDAAPQTQQQPQPQMQAPLLQQPQASPVLPASSAVPATSAVNIGGIPNVSPPIGAVDMLQKNPDLAPYFDQKYGQGSAAAALGK